jgi:hypothetical protein
LSGPELWLYPVDPYRLGVQMETYFAVFLEFREGTIIKQRNYDCFEGW